MTVNPAVINEIDFIERVRAEGGRKWERVSCRERKDEYPGYDLEFSRWRANELWADRTYATCPAGLKEERGPAMRRDPPGYYDLDTGYGPTIEMLALSFVRRASPELWTPTAKTGALAWAWAPAGVHVMVQVQVRVVPSSVTDGA
jgi:hypothetical protein